MVYYRSILAVNKTAMFETLSHLVNQEELIANICDADLNTAGENGYILWEGKMIKSDHCVQIRKWYSVQALLDAVL